tara:strand:+ start:18909 stop:20816 length:1908 start_codon:yes stop_codon:yes gene_type:complete
MKFHIDHIKNLIDSDIQTKELSEKLFQLGHENTVSNNIIDIEFTPNRGDCLSITGLVRDLKPFYDIKNLDIYNENIRNWDFNFENKLKKSCPNISFLRIDIDEEVKEFSGQIAEYFKELNIKRNNFFTDVSNYLSYEIGIPTHCYDSRLFENSTLILEEIHDNIEFETLIDKKINLKDKNDVFTLNSNVINLAGVMGGKSTACAEDTRSVIVECAYFKPENIIGKTIKYDLQSDAAYKFERGVDPMGQEKALRRFIMIVEKYAKIKNIQIYQQTQANFERSFQYDPKKINSITGLNLSKKEQTEYLEKLGFSFQEDQIFIPSYRHDIFTNNDLAEEIARIIGYDNIPRQEIKICNTKSNGRKELEDTVKLLLVDNGFNEVINEPFTKENTISSIELDNPLDSNKPYLRQSLKSSLVSNLVYNERRQKDSIKLFEISDIYKYDNSKVSSKKILGVIASGRLGNNYRDFSKNIDLDYLTNTLKKITDKDLNFEILDRKYIDSKSKFPIIYLEIELDKLFDNLKKYKPLNKLFYQNEVRYIPVSEFPSTIRDLSFLVKDKNKLDDLDKVITGLDDNLLKDIFIFDYYVNQQKNYIKIGYRFVFQSSKNTLTDSEINDLMKKIIKQSLSINSIEIPGLN